MKWEITYSPETAVIQVPVWDGLVISDLRQMLDELLGDERWFSGCSVLYDYNDLDVSLTSTFELGRVRDVYGEYRDRCEKCRTALFASSALRYGLARQFQALAGLSDSEKLQVFRSVPDAIAWLLIDPLENTLANT